MSEYELDLEAEAMQSLMLRLQQEATDWSRRRADEPFFPFVIEKYRNRDPGEPYQVCVRQKGGKVHGYWRREICRYFFSAEPLGMPVIGVDTEDEAVAHTRAYCTRRAELKGTGSAPQAHSKPDGLSIMMVDAETNEGVRVFVNAAVLHGTLDRYQGANHRYHLEKVLEQHRHRIEEAANRKYVQKGVLGELDGKPALWVQASDL